MATKLRRCPNCKVPEPHDKRQIMTFHPDDERGAWCCNCGWQSLEYQAHPDTLREQAEAQALADGLKAAFEGMRNGNS